LNYLEIIQNVLSNGVQKTATRYDSNGEVIPVENGTIGTFCEIFRHDMSKGFPLTTLRRMPWKSIRVELEGFIKGITDKKWYQERGCKFWDHWHNPESDNTNDLGEIYGYLWRCFPPDESIIKVKPKISTYSCENSVVAFEADVKPSDGDELGIVLIKNWYDMMNRCYNEKCTQYKWYGALGVKVCDRWHTYSNYLEDIKHIIGWQMKMRTPRNVSLDKDYYSSSVYAPDVCVFLTSRENKLYNSCKPVKIEKDGEYHICLNYTQAAKIMDCTRRAIPQAIENGKKCKGWTCTNLDGTYRYNLPSDQLKTIVEKLKNSPYDRRMVCTAWNPTNFHKIALNSCHWSFNVVVYGDKLNLIWHQRSCDLLLGVGSNIASYALLLLLLCEESGLKPGELVGTLADCHIYENHLPAAKELVGRVEGVLPEVKIDRKPDGSFSIFDWTYDQVDLLGYNPQDKLDIGAVTV